MIAIFQVAVRVERAAALTPAATEATLSGDRFLQVE